MKTCSYTASNPPNHRRILTYLIPLRILRGHLPSRELLDQFPVVDDLYSPFITAIHKGDISSFDAALEKYERRLVELNLLLTLEKARELCIRGLFRRVYVVHSILGCLLCMDADALTDILHRHRCFSWVVSQKATRIPISLFHSALQISGMSVSTEEAECLVANMVYKGLMRGYISHEKQMVVLANTNAFPRLSDRVSPYAVL